MAEFTGLLLSVVLPVNNGARTLDRWLGGGLISVSAPPARVGI